VTQVYEFVFLDEAVTEENIKRSSAVFFYDREVRFVELLLSPEAPPKPDSFYRGEVVAKGTYRTVVPGVPAKVV